jgi:hypothetical protein
MAAKNVCIFPASKSATQSGLARSKGWILRFEGTAISQIEPLMGWLSSGDTLQQVRLQFSTQEEAIAYATRNGFSWRIEEPKPVKRRIAAYSDNFTFSRSYPWTH